MHHEHMGALFTDADVLKIVFENRMCLLSSS